MSTHLDNKKNPKIVDISSKKITKRSAKGLSIIKFSNNSFEKIKSLTTKKGSIENLAIIAGIAGAKKTSELIPLCHNIFIEDVSIKIEILKKNSSIKIVSSVKSESKTGVEMEALTAVSIASLTIYDMCKSIDKNIKITNIELLEKKGGKSDYSKKLK